MKKILTVYCFLFYTFSCSALAAAYMEKGDYTNANAVLNDLAQLPEMANQVKIQRVAMDLKQQPEGIYALQTDAASKQKVQDVAADSAMYGYAPPRAMLSAVFGNYYPELIERMDAAVLRKAIAAASTIEDAGVKEGKLFPNPNEGNMQLRYELAEGGSGSLEIYDITGKLLSTYKLQQGSSTLQIHEENLAQGVYFYKLVVNGRLTASDKLVIIK